MFPEIPGKESIQVKLDLLPVLPGIQVRERERERERSCIIILQTIGPLSLCDVLSSNNKQVFNKLGQVYVQLNSTKPHPHDSTQQVINTIA